MENKRCIVCFGPGPIFKGGISDYNTSLALALDKQENTEVHMVSWTQQYPAIIPRSFIDESSKTDVLEASGVKVKYITNYNKPKTWKETAQYIASLKPEMVIFQWSIAIQGLPIEKIIKHLRKHRDIEIVMDLHFVLQKESSSIDATFTKWGLQYAHSYIVHAYKTYDELQVLFPDRKLTISVDGRRVSETEGQTVIKLFHPIYDMFAPNPNFNIEDFKAKHGLKKHVFLFFGFIRKYKGLHNSIEAFARLAAKRDDVSLLICGESFWDTLDQSKISTRIKNALFGLAKSIFLRKQDDERKYRPLELIDQLGIQDKCVLFNRFIPNEEVYQFFQASDAVLLYYLTATPSGIESLSYNFQLPILATKVGHFPETIEDAFNGYLAEAGDIDSMATQMERLIENPIPRENIKAKTQELSWENYAKAILMK